MLFHELKEMRVWSFSTYFKTLKAMIIKEETILGISKPESKVSSEAETANAVFDGVCNFVTKKDTRKLIVLSLKNSKMNLNLKKPIGVTIAMQQGTQLTIAFGTQRISSKAKAKAEKQDQRQRPRQGERKRRKRQKRRTS